MSAQSSSLDGMKNGRPSTPLERPEHHDPLIRHLVEWTRQVGEQPPSRVAQGIAACARKYHEQLKALPLNATIQSETTAMVPQSMRAFTGPDTLKSYCVRKGFDRECSEWQVVYEMLYAKR